MANLNPANRYAIPLLLSAMLLPVLGGCSNSSDSPPDVPGDDILMNQVQYLGTHNSYHMQTRADVFELLLAFIPDVAPTLEYTHIPLQEQFDTQGIRQIELDVFDDPQGGLYANHPVRTLFGEDAASGIPELDEPGLKVLHVQDIDYETTCYTFVSCLQEIKTWSDSHPGHLPITVLVEAKDDVIPDPLKLDFVVPLEFGTAALDRIDDGNSQCVSQGATDRARRRARQFRLRWSWPFSPRAGRACPRRAARLCSHWTIPTTPAITISRGTPHSRAGCCLPTRPPAHRKRRS